VVGELVTDLIADRLGIPRRVAHAITVLALLAAGFLIGRHY
jgi:uncharacterized membrane-anchored protein